MPLLLQKACLMLISGTFKSKAVLFSLVKESGPVMLLCKLHLDNPVLRTAHIQNDGVFAGRSL